MSETAGRTLIIATILCIVCSVFVSSAVVTLKPRQAYEAELDFKKNILKSAGLYKEGVDINEVFKQIEPVVIDLSTGDVAEEVDMKTYSQDKADKDPAYLETIPAKQDIAGIKRRSRLQTVYIVKKDGVVDQIVLHIYGKGLWGTMKGFLALDKDTKTVRGFNYYAHSETPGLGGEVDNPKWIAQWPGKVVYDENWKPAVDVLKSVVPEGAPNFEHKIDGLSGATITSVGIEGTFNYWLSYEGYGKFLEIFRDSNSQDEVRNEN